MLLKAFTYAKKEIAYCDKLFYIEEQLKEISKDERYRKRLEQEKPVIDEFWKWIYDTEPIVLPKTKLGKAIAYAINQKPYMENYLKDGRCALSNNAAENSIRLFNRTIIVDNTFSATIKNSGGRARVK